MSKPIYTDAGTDYPELMQPQGNYMAEAEDEFDGQEVTWDPGGAFCCVVTTDPSRQGGVVARGQTEGNPRRRFAVSP